MPGPGSTWSPICSGHAAITSSQVYLHPDTSRLRAAVDAVPSPREQAGASR